MRKQGADNKLDREIKGHVMSPQLQKIIWVKDHTGSSLGELLQWFMKHKVGLIKHENNKKVL